jgi:membrane protein involved in colicin uptake
MSGLIPKELEWKPPERIVSEEERRAFQASLEGYKAFGRAADCDFSVDEEMRRRGLLTNAEVDAQLAAEKAAKEAAAEQKAKAQNEAAERAADRTTLDRLARQLRELEGGRP